MEVITLYGPSFFAPFTVHLMNGTRALSRTATRIYLIGWRTSPVHVLADGSTGFTVRRRMNLVNKIRSVLRTTFNSFRVFCVFRGPTLSGQVYGELFPEFPAFT